MECKYKSVLSCKECNVVYVKQCKKFLVAHAKDMSRELLPFKYNSAVKPTAKVVQSVNQDKAKSAALKFAIEKGLRIRKLSMSQVMSIILSGEDNDYTIVYVECNQKVFADVEKVKSVLQSFVDQVTLHGGRVAIYNSQITNLRFDYERL